MCETDLLLCESVISVAAQATHIPVGSSEGAPMRRKANRSSTDMERCCMGVSVAALFWPNSCGVVGRERKASMTRTDRMICSCSFAGLRCEKSRESATLCVACPEIRLNVQHEGRKSRTAGKTGISRSAVVFCDDTMRAD